MFILVACEESQAVCAEFRKKGHIAFSCDLQKCSGGHPEWHINSDVLKILNGNCFFTTQDNEMHYIDGEWDMIIAHPPCTDLCVSGARHFEKKRADGRQAESIRFFMNFINAKCEKICIENPVGIISGNYIKEYFPSLCNEYNLPLPYTQIIQPYEYGDKVRKTTCLWLKGLKPLTPTNVVEPELITYICKDGKKATFSTYLVHCKGNRSKHRSKTFPGIAKAMAEQWG